MSPFFEPLENRAMLSGTIGMATLQPNAYEQGQQPASFFVYRQDRVPTATRVYFTVGGTATSNLAASPGNPADYTGLNAPPVVIANLPAAVSLTSSVRATAPALTTTRLISPFGSNTAYVDIPAEQTYTLVTITPIDDTRVEPMETAIFTLQSNANYTVGSPSSVTLDIHDNDGPVYAPDVADATIRDGASANTTFGHAADLETKKAAFNSGLNRGTFIQFDLSNIDPLADYGHITLKLFGNLNNTNQKNVVTNVFGDGNISWNESTITWNNRPLVLTRGPIAPLASATILDNTPRWYSFDVTAYVEAELAAGHKTTTFVLSDPNLSDPFVTFHSRESGSNVPQLVFNT